MKKMMMSRKICVALLLPVLGLVGCGPQMRKLTQAISAAASSVEVSDGLPVADHRMFLTSVDFTGRLGDGLAGADAFCGSLAASAGLTRTYRAILSDTIENAVDRILDGGGKVYTFDNLGMKRVVFNSVPEMWSADTVNPPLYTELNTISATGAVATGSNTDGTFYAVSCNGFGPPAPPAYGYGTQSDFYTETLMVPPFGSVDHSGGGLWLHDFYHGHAAPPPAPSCLSDLPIYCISQ